LVARHFTIQRAVDDKADFFLTELTTVALFFDQELESRLDKPTGWDVSFACHE
jgi:hypothetical protein